MVRRRRLDIVRLGKHVRGDTQFLWVIDVFMRLHAIVGGFLGLGFLLIVSRTRAGTKREMGAIDAGAHLGVHVERV